MVAEVLRHKQTLVHKAGSWLASLARLRLTYAESERVTDGAGTCDLL
jgi:hypothetical protein